MSASPLNAALNRNWIAASAERERLERENAALRAELEGVRRDAVPVADILAKADHVAENGAAVARFGGQHEHEGRCRELCAMYLRELVSAFRLKQLVTTIRKEGSDA